MSKKPLPTKTQVIETLQALKSKGERVTVCDANANLAEMISAVHFEVDPIDHRVYLLKVDELISDDWDLTCEYGPELLLEVEINGAWFAKRGWCRDIAAGEVAWESERKLRPGEHADEYTDIDATISRLLEEYVEVELPNPKNCPVPYDGIDSGMLLAALESLEAEATLYTNGGDVKAVPSGEKDDEIELDPDGWRKADAYSVAGMLDEEMEYELDWSEVEER